VQEEKEPSGNAKKNPLVTFSRVTAAKNCVCSFSDAWVFKIWRIFSKSGMPTEPHVGAMWSHGSLYEHEETGKDQLFHGGKRLGDTSCSQGEAARSSRETAGKVEVQSNHSRGRKQNTAVREGNRLMGK